MLWVKPDTCEGARIQIGHLYSFFAGVFLSTYEIYNSSPVEGAFYNFSHIVFVGVKMDVGVRINQHSVRL
jgi:hypothetical protein